jgi:hypothetical protein
MRLTCRGQVFHEQDIWPADLLPKTLPVARILTWGYDVDVDHVLSSASTATVFQHASDLLSDLADVRMDETEVKRPVIFIAHSLGGIIVKDISYCYNSLPATWLWLHQGGSPIECIGLNQSRSTTTHLSEVLPATLGICFLGTSHRGSSKASLSETMHKLVGKSPNLQILQALKYDAETLGRV